MGYTRSVPGKRGIVVFRPGALGDTLLTIEALAAIRRTWPDESIELVGNAPAGVLLLEAGLIDRVTAFDCLDVTGLYAQPPRVAGRWHNLRAAVLWLGSPDLVGAVLRGAGAATVHWASPHPPPAMHTRITCLRHCRILDH